MRAVTSGSAFFVARPDGKVPSNHVQTKEQTKVDPTARRGGRGRDADGRETGRDVASRNRPETAKFRIPRDETRRFNLRILASHARPRAHGAVHGERSLDATRQLGRVRRTARYTGYTLQTTLHGTEGAEDTQYLIVKEDTLSGLDEACDAMRCHSPRAGCRCSQRLLHETSLLYLWSTVGQ